jgi:hypothetical protein
MSIQREKLIIRKRNKYDVGPNIQFYTMKVGPYQEKECTKPLVSSAALNAIS